MGKAHPIELRERVVDFVEEGNTHRASAAHFRVSVKFVNDMVRLKQETGSLQPKTQGHPGGSKLDRVEEWVRRRLYEKSANSKSTPSSSGNLMIAWCTSRAFTLSSPVSMERSSVASSAGILPVP